ncbi:MAG: hypothetical protein ABIE36_02180 [Candidatus Diapherotrites archaeon]
MENEKITLTKRIIREEKREFKIGKKGDFVLVESKGGHLVLGIFEEIIHTKNKKNNYDMAYVSFLDKLYTLGFVDFYNGIKIPIFSPNNMEPSFSHNKPSVNSYNVKNLRDIVFGKENIINYLNKREEGKYKSHANLLEGYLNQ